MFKVQQNSFKLANCISPIFSFPTLSCCSSTVAASQCERLAKAALPQIASSSIPGGQHIEGDFSALLNPGLGVITLPETNSHSIPPPGNGPFGPKKEKNSNLRTNYEFSWGVWKCRVHFHSIWMLHRIAPWLVASSNIFQARGQTCDPSGFCCHKMPTPQRKKRKNRVPRAPKKWNMHLNLKKILQTMSQNVQRTIFKKLASDLVDKKMYDLPIQEIQEEICQATNCIWHTAVHQLRNLQSARERSMRSVLKKVPLLPFVLTTLPIGHDGLLPKVCMSTPGLKRTFHKFLPRTGDNSNKR